MIHFSEINFFSWVIICLTVCSTVCCAVQETEDSTKNNLDEGETRGASHIKKYFDLVHWIQIKIETLKKNDISLSKVIIINNKKDSVFITNPSWTDNLRFYQNLDLNNKKYEGKFSENKKRLKSGIWLTSYQQKSGKNPISPLIQLNIASFSSKEEINHIQAHLSFVNYLYVRKEIVSMTLDEEGNIEKYSIQGGSKMMGQDTLVYHIRGQTVRKYEH